MEKILYYIQKYFDSCWQEMLTMAKDEGALLFCVILPLAYPVIYSWIYNNEVAREVPVVVVDQSHSADSRKFIQMLHASPDVEADFFAESIEDAKRYIGHGDAYGIIYFPKDFSTRIGRHEQAHVSVYCDMSYMLTYKAIFQTATAVSMEMGDDIKAELSGSFTDREKEISSKPLDFEEVPIFNVTAGYGNFVLPGVLVLIIHQALLLCVGLLAGTDREKKYQSVKGVVTSLMGKTTAYFLVYFVMLAYVSLVIPRMFGFVMMAQGLEWVMFMCPYLLSCVLFSILISQLVRYRENVLLIVVFTSLPFLFLSGVSWPQSNMPGVWQAIASLVPSTYGIRGFVKMSSMGATLTDVTDEIRALWMQVIFYGLQCILIMWYRRKIHLKYYS